MLELIEANKLAFALALLIGFVVAWWLFRQTTRQDRGLNRRPDVLDEGAAPAQRNQSLIDAPSASSAAVFTPPPSSGTMAGVGEVIAAAAQDEVAAAAPAPAPSGTGDDLLRIKGVGPKLAALLQSLGVTRFEQIASWSDADVDRIDAQLGTFSGRIRRDDWIGQARLLASGDTAAYEARFGKL
jgi:predicted flap endonuclease-1-like 5' DNA nuclease